MFRTALKTLSQRATVVTSTRSATISFRSYSASSLSNDQIQSRILEILKSFEKVDPAKVSPLTVPLHHSSFDQTRRERVEARTRDGGRTEGRREKSPPRSNA